MSANKKEDDSPTDQWYSDNPAKESDPKALAKGLNIEPRILEVMEECARINAECYAKADGFIGVLEQLARIHGGARCVFEGVRIPPKWYTGALCAIITMSANKKEDDLLTSHWYERNPVHALSEDSVIARGLNIEPGVLDVMKEYARNNVESYVRADGCLGVLDQLERIYGDADCVFKGVEIPTKWYTGALCAIVTMSANEKKDVPPTSDWYDRNPVHAKSYASVIAKGLNIEPRILEEMKECARNNVNSRARADGHPGVPEQLEQIHGGAKCVFEGVRIPPKWYTGALCAIVTMSTNEEKDTPPTIEWYNNNPLNAKSLASVIAVGLNLRPESVEIMYRAMVGTCAIIHAGGCSVANDSKHPGVLGLLENKYTKWVSKAVEIPIEWYIGAFYAIVTQSETKLPWFLVKEYYSRGTGAITAKGLNFWKGDDNPVQSTKR
jgi:hypothetical protein